MEKESRKWKKKKLDGARRWSTDNLEFLQEIKNRSRCEEISRKTHYLMKHFSFLFSVRLRHLNLANFFFPLYPNGKEYRVIASFFSFHWKVPLDGKLQFLHGKIVGIFFNLGLIVRILRNWMFGCWKL
jgi:hypothetical protein